MSAEVTTRSGPSAPPLPTTAVRVWSWVALLVGVPVVWVYRTRIGDSLWWDDVWAVATTVLAVVQLIAVHRRAWTVAVTALSVLAVPWAVFLLALAAPWPWFAAGFMAVPGLLPWLPALAAAYVAQRRSESAAGLPTPAQAAARARAWSYVPVAVGGAVVVLLLAVTVARRGEGWAVLSAVLAAVVAGVSLVSLRAALLVRSGSFRRAADSAVAPMVLWPLLGLIGMVLLLGPLALLAVPVAQSARWCGRLARAGAAVTAAGDVVLTATPQDAVQPHDSGMSQA